VKSATWLKDKVATLIKAGIYEEAIPYLERLLRLPGAKPFDLHFAHFTLGEVHYEAGRWPRAQRHFQKALDVGGEDPVIMLLLGQVCCAQGKHNKARTVLEQAWKLKPRDTHIELTLGTCMCMQGEFDQAEEVFRRAVEREDAGFELYVGLAQSLMGQHRWDDAKVTLEDARERFPLALPIRQALKDLEKIDKLEDLYNWIASDAVDDYLESYHEYDNIPAKLARTALAEFQFPVEAIEGCARLWEDYLRVGDCMPRVPEVWAAGIVYTIARLYDRSEISQANLARRFEVSPASVSRVFRALSDELKIKENDPRYTGASEQDKLT